MASAINALHPVSGNPTTASVRDNFAAAKSEIEALQSGGGGGGGYAKAFLANIPYPNAGQFQTLTGSPPEDGQILINRTTGAIMYWDGGIWSPAST